VLCVALLELRQRKQAERLEQEQEQKASTTTEASETGDGDDRKVTENGDMALRQNGRVEGHNGAPAGDVEVEGEGEMGEVESCTSAVMETADTEVSGEPLGELKEMVKLESSNQNAAAAAADDDDVSMKGHNESGMGDMVKTVMSADTGVPDKPLDELKDAVKLDSDVDEVMLNVTAASNQNSQNGSEMGEVENMIETVASGDTNDEVLDKIIESVETVKAAAAIDKCIEPCDTAQPLLDAAAQTTEDVMQPGPASEIQTPDDTAAAAADECVDVIDVTVHCSTDRHATFNCFQVCSLYSRR